jgi:choline dehydrogenase-like flavoprotein
MFSTGETPHGCGHVPRTVYQGIRTTGADFVTNKYHRDNIKILVDTTVDRIEIERKGEALRASGVHLLSKDGKKSTPRARKEVIISSGAYCSPTILLRSGIGPKDELAKVGIQSVVDLPGVGKNLLDHPVSLLSSHPSVSTSQG